MEILKAFAVEAPIASCNAVIIRGTVAVATAIIDGTPLFRGRATPPTVRARSFS